MSMPVVRDPKVATRDRRNHGTSWRRTPRRSRPEAYARRWHRAVLPRRLWPSAMPATEHVRHRAKFRKVRFVARQFVCAQRSQRLRGSIERHVDDIARVPTISSVRIAKRNCQKAMRRKNDGGSIDPSRPFAFRAVQKQNRRKGTVAGRTVTPTATRRRAANDFERHEKSLRNIA